ncbi:unnamed protein product [Dovyalis caffra]|uniref:Uncharacterized protein n=1 Tax=Dovyalis caffra TaxID=77055 RepID=A0AAV1S6W7_9ROSI|nr:unnamed protein product [Dovyalis caffra]
MEIAVSSPISSSAVDLGEINSKIDKDQVRVRRKTLEVVLEQCQRALELLNNTDGVDDYDDDDGDTSGTKSKEVESLPSRDSSLASLGDREADELCDLLKSRVECPDFLEKLECAQLSVSHNISDADDFLYGMAEEGSSWDMIDENDLWEGENDGSDEEDYVLVRQEDIVEGIACFMAAYLLSLKQTKAVRNFFGVFGAITNTDVLSDILTWVLSLLAGHGPYATPGRTLTSPVIFLLALSKTFSVKKKKGKLKKAWDGSKVIYNVASWGATAIG